MFRSRNAHQPLVLWTISWAPYLVYSLRHTRDSPAGQLWEVLPKMAFSFSVPRSTGLGERSTLLSQCSPRAQAEGPGTAESSGWAQGPRVA